MDPLGPRRLTTLFNALQPTDIALERDEKSSIRGAALFAQAVSRNATRRRETIRHIGRYMFGDTEYIHTQDLRHFSQWFFRTAGFESRYAERFARRTGARIHAIDDPGPQTPSALEQLALQAVVYLDCPVWQWTRDGALRNSADLYDDCASLLVDLPLKTRVELDHRDTVMAANLRSIAKESTTPVCVVGLGHTHGYRDNLYDRLADLNPVRIRLCDADSPHAPRMLQSMLSRHA